MARATSGGVLSPGKAFFLLLIPVVVAGLLALFFVGRDEAPGPTTSSRTAEGFALTDAEAIAKFEELNELRLRALRERDPSLLSLAFTPDSPIADNVAKSIRQLTRSGIIRRTAEETQSVVVISSDSAEIQIREIVVIDPLFVDESGKDVTGERFRERQTVEWTLRLVGDRWLLHDGLVIGAEPVKARQKR